MDFCSADANQGFPINIQGQLAENEERFKALKSIPEVHFSFADYTIKRELYARRELDTTKWGKCFMTESNNSSLTYKGFIYNLKTIQICAATHSGSSWPRRPGPTNNADIIFTYSRTNTMDSNPSVFIVVIPLYLLSEISVSRSASVNAEAFFASVIENTEAIKSATPQASTAPKYPSLSTLFNDLTDKAAVFYMSCIQLRPPPQAGKWLMKRMTAATLYYPGGLIISDQKILWALGGKNKLEFSPYILPAECRNKFLTPIRQPPLANSSPEDVQKFIMEGTNWSSEGELRANMISVAATDFTRRFKWIENAVSGMTGTKRLKTTVEYQCLPLDKVKDIQGSNVLLDPATGTRSLKDTLEPTADEQAAALAAKKSSSAAITFAIVIGSICAFLVLIVGGSYIVRYLLKRVDTPEGMGIVSEAAQNLASAR